MNIFVQEIKDRYYTVIKAFYDEAGEETRTGNFIDNYLIVDKIPHLFKNPWGVNYSEDLIKYILDEDDRLDVHHFQGSGDTSILCVGIKEEIVKRNPFMQKAIKNGMKIFRERKKI